MIISLIIKVAFVLTLLFSGWSDARRFLIPNIYPAILILLFVIAQLTDFGFAAPLWQYLLHFAVALAAGMFLFYIRWFGGGDAKLYAAVALWFSITDAVLLIFVTTVAGGVVVVFRMIWHMFSISFGEGGQTGRTRLFERRIAYGIAIAAGGIIALLSIYPPDWSALHAF